MAIELGLGDLIDLFKTQNLWLEGQGQETISQIVADTRELENLGNVQNVLYVARRGVTRDGHEFLTPLANDRRIAAFLVEKIPAGFQTKKPVIVVRDTTAAMAYAVKRISGDPTRDSVCVAVTGTNGKTTSTFLIQSLLKIKGHRVVRMGTIETEFEGDRIASELTTPDFSTIQKLFKDFKNRGANAYVFEASSHALEQKRLLGLELDAAVFTNLTPEHLDYHRTMEAYYLAKRKLFFELLRNSEKKNKWAIVPDDGAFGSRLSDELTAASDMETLRWAFKDKATAKTRFVISNWKTSLEGSRLDILADGKRLEFTSPLVGRFNIENLMGMIVYGLGLGMKSESIQAAMAQAGPVPGRLQKVDNSRGVFVFVDYAHTPDALENVLSTLRPLTKGKLKVLFGCGGDRDKLKRPKMGTIAELYGDELFVTSDNPRTEDPEEIIREILQGVQRLKPISIYPDRRDCIRRAVASLQSNDVLVVAGKGHENYQIVGQTKNPFDDSEEVRRAFGL